MIKDIYSNQNSEYLEKNKTWHAEDSPWKAGQIRKMLTKQKLQFKSIVEIGCGVGEILYELDKHINNPKISYDGYDIAPDAIKIAKQKEKSNVRFRCENLLEKKDMAFDLMLMIDVFEHVPNYLEFLSACNDKAEYFIFHIPLDINCNNILRGKLTRLRDRLGHIHYFTRKTALAALEDTGYEIVDSFYTAGCKLPNRSIETKILNIPRSMIFPIAPDFIVHLLGGYSLLVLAKKN